MNVLIDPRFLRGSIRDASTEFRGVISRIVWNVGVFWSLKTGFLE